MSDCIQLLDSQPSNVEAAQLREIRPCFTNDNRSDMSELIRRLGAANEARVYLPQPLVLRIDNWLQSKRGQFVEATLRKLR